MSNIEIFGGHFTELAGSNVCSIALGWRVKKSVGG